VGQRPLRRNRLFNARAETLADKPSFRSAYGARRLAIPVDGFYEWHKTPGGSRQPYFFRRADGAPVVFAGLYEFWRDPTIPDGEHPWVRSCTIITTAAGEDMAAIHDRMPAILESDAFDAWLDPDAERPVLDGLLLPLRAARWHAWRWIGAWATSPTTVPSSSTRQQRTARSPPPSSESPALGRWHIEAVGRAGDPVATVRGDATAATGRRPPATLTTRT